MKRALLALGLLAIIATSLCIGSLSLAAPRLAETAVSYAQQPPGPNDAIAAQRDQALARQQGSSWGWWVAGGLVTAVLVVGGVLIWRYVSADYLKQQRLAARALARQRQRQRPQQPAQSFLQEVPRTPASHQLPSGRGEQ